MKSYYFLFICLFINNCGSSNKILIKQECAPRDITSLPKALKKPQKYKGVAIANYQDSVFPSKDILKLKNLECLQIHGPNKTEQGKKFNGSYSKLYVDTEQLNELTNLISLKLAWFDLRNFPSGLFHLKNLKVLYLDCSFLDSIPGNIQNLQNLELLSLRLNKISQLLPWFNRLKKLKALDLANNAFEHIPPVLFELEKLQVVSLANPEEYKDSEKESFELHTNKIDYIKNIDSLVKLLSMENMKWVHIDVNSYDKKEKIISLLREKGLDKKIRINVRSIASRK